MGGTIPYVGVFVLGKCEDIRSSTTKQVNMHAFISLCSGLEVLQASATMISLLLRTEPGTVR